MRFSNCHTVSPVCQPSRVSFITGTYPHNHGIWYNRGELPINYPTLFSQLHDAGYHTATVGKSHLWSHKKVSHLREGEPYLQALGFDVIDELGGPRGVSTRTRTSPTTCARRICSSFSSAIRANGFAIQSSSNRRRLRRTITWTGTWAGARSSSSILRPGTVRPVCSSISRTT